jgi:hypothetical protein
VGVPKTPGGSARKKKGEGKKTQALLHVYFIFSEDRYAKNKDRLYNNNNKQKAAAGAPPAATDATGAAPLSLDTPAAAGALPAATGASAPVETEK